MKQIYVLLCTLYREILSKYAKMEFLAGLLILMGKVIMSKVVEVV